MLGYPRSSGAFGARNEVLVLPSVVCSTRVAQRIAGSDAVAITHPHGCAHVGEDAIHAGEVFAGIAAHPNVAGVVVVGLGCETIQGRELAETIAARGQRVEFCSIQESGGSEATFERGRQLVAALRSEAQRAERVRVLDDAMRVGLDDPSAPIANALREALGAAGVPLIEPRRGPGPAAHAELAAEGAQILVSYCRPGDAPRGFAICPVVSVAGDAASYAALPDDFDLSISAGIWKRADDLVQLLRDVFNGAPTAAERRGAREFELRRLTRSM